MRSTPHLSSPKAAATLLGFALAFLFICATISPASAQCVASFREIKFPDGSARVKNYVCKSEGSAKPDIRVEFDRLSEAAAGNLIEGEPYPELDKAFGKVRLVNNAVAVETKKLFDDFGVKSSRRPATRFKSRPPPAARAMRATPTTIAGKRAMWYITFPDREDLTTLNFPLPADIEYYQANSDWPHGYSFFYKGGEYCDGETSLIYCTLIWRPANAADIANYEANQAAYDKALELGESTPEQAAQDVESGESADLSGEPDATSTELWGNAPKRYFSLVDYLTARRLARPIFSSSPARLPECGGGIDFSIHIRQMVLDVAFIQNISSKPVSIDGLLGSEAPGLQVAPGRADASCAASRIALAPGEIKPGETIAVPLAISFIMADSLERAVPECGRSRRDLQGASSRRSPAPFSS